VIGKLEQRVPMPIEGASAQAAGGVRRSCGTEISDERRASWQARSFGVHRQDSPSQTPKAERAYRPPLDFARHWETLWLCFSSRLVRLDQLSTGPPALTATANANVVQPSSAGMRRSRFLTRFDCFSLLRAD